MSPDRFKFEPAKLPAEAFSYEHHMAKGGVSKPEAKRIVEQMKAERVVLSDTYQVNITEIITPLGPMTWLSIKRRDKEAFHDWRELQNIKNAVVCSEREGCELYPAESRLVDTANQYHLWVLPEGMRFPFGYTEREVISESKNGAIQRPFEKPNAT